MSTYARILCAKIGIISDIFTILIPKSSFSLHFFHSPTRSSLFILVLTPIFITQFQQFQELAKPRFRQFPRVQQFPSPLEKVHHQPFLRHILRWIPLIGLNKADHLFIASPPPFLLSHALTSSVFLEGWHCPF